MITPGMNDVYTGVEQKIVETADLGLGCGIAMLAASVLAGALWHYVGPQATFLAGARKIVEG